MNRRMKTFGKMRVARSSAVLLGAAALCSLHLSGSGAAAGTAGGNAPVAGTPRGRTMGGDKKEPFTVYAELLTSKKRYRAGETVRFTIVARNIGTTRQILRFRSGQSFDITATSDDEEQRWDWSRGMMFTQALRSIVLEPGAAFSWTAIWKQVDNDGELMARGPVIIKARLLANVTINMAPRTIRLTD
jgi:hypothetical protein